MIRIGASGWSYDEWVGPFYPVHLRARPSEWLAYYATRFRTVEINSTFYAMPSQDLVADWARTGVLLQGRGPFEYSLKLPREVTHAALVEGDVESARSLTGRFDREVLDALAGEDLLGAVLIQLSPRFTLTAANVDALQEVVEALAERRVALEFRHPSWVSDGGVAPEAERLFASRDVALVEQDNPAMPPAVAPRLATHAYLRLHGRREEYWTGDKAHVDTQDGARYDYLYTTEALRPFAERAVLLEAQRRDVRIYFNNTPQAKALVNALDLMAMTGLLPPDVARPRLTAQTRLEG